MISPSGEHLTTAIVTAKAVIQNLNEKFVSAQLLDVGSTSEVVLVKTEQASYVLRKAKPRPGKSIAYLSDAGIRRTLIEYGCPVAQPIATNQSISINVEGRWSLDSFCLGEHPVRGSIPSTISRQLGALLNVLHRLPVAGYGKLNNTDKRFCGQFNNPTDGLLSRFESPWPFSNNPIEQHPSVCDNPSLVTKLKSIENELVRFPGGGTPVLVHSDLHEAQLLVKNQKLNALLDFNEAMVGRLEWDLGSYYYFHGKACLQDLLEGYTDDITARSQYFRDALPGAILIALHHGNRGVVLRKPHRIEACARFLKLSLDEQPYKE